MSDDSMHNCTDDIEDTIEGWIINTNIWANAAENEGLDKREYYEDMLQCLDYLQNLGIPSAIERVKFLLNHEHDYDDGTECIHCEKDLLDA